MFAELRGGRIKKPFDRRASMATIQPSGDNKLNGRSVVRPGPPSQQTGFALVCCARLSVGWWCAPRGSEWKL